MNAKRKVNIHGSSEAEHFFVQPKALKVLTKITFHLSPEFKVCQQKAWASKA